MSNYTQITNFTAKDSLASGNAAKKVKGVDFDGEFAAISTAITSKADKTGATFTGTVDLADSVRLRFGAGSDLQIYHDGTESFISDTGTGNLTIASIWASLASSAAAVTTDRARAVEIFATFSRASASGQYWPSVRLV